MALIRRVWTSLFEKGTQKRRIFKRKHRGNQAGMTPVEKEVIWASVVPKGGRGENRKGRQQCSMEERMITTI